MKVWEVSGKEAHGGTETTYICVVYAVDEYVALDIAKAFHGNIDWTARELNQQIQFHCLAIIRKN